MLRCDFADAGCSRVLHSKVRQEVGVSAQPRSNGLHTAGVGLMNKLAEIRSQEYMCRERAALDSERKVFWLAQAEEWEQRALDEIAYHFRECNLDSVDPQLSAA